MGMVNLASQNRPVKHQLEKSTWQYPVEKQLSTDRGWWANRFSQPCFLWLALQNCLVDYNMQLINTDFYFLFISSQWFERHFKDKLNEIPLKRSLFIKYKLKSQEKIKTPGRKDRMAMWQSDATNTSWNLKINRSPSDLQVEFNMNFSGLSGLEIGPQRSSRGSQCDKKPATNFRLSMQQGPWARSWKLLSSCLSSSCPPNTNKVNRVAREWLLCKLNHRLILQALLQF